MKGCLKQSDRTCPASKCVAFRPDDIAVVYLADDWDRTPMEPARNLSYQDLMELRDIKKSLPYASQPSDAAKTRYLSTVPVPLVPLLPAGQESTEPVAPSIPTWSRISFRAPNKAPGFSPGPTPPSTAPSIPTSPPKVSKPPLRPFIQPPPPRPIVSPWTPAHLAHMTPKSALPPRPKPTFSFVPLLDTPKQQVPPPTPAPPVVANPSTPTPKDPAPPTALPSDLSVPPLGSVTPTSPQSSCASSDCGPDLTDAETEADMDGDPPTPSWANATLKLTDADNVDVALGTSTEGLGLQLNPQTTSYFDLPSTPASDKPVLRALQSPCLSPPSPLVLDLLPPPEKKKRFILVNDIEIELEDD